MKEFEQYAQNVKHRTSLSVENGQHREQLIVVEELIEAHFAKYIYHINMHLLFLQI